MMSSDVKQPLRGFLEIDGKKILDARVLLGASGIRIEFGNSQQINIFSFTNFHVFYKKENVQLTEDYKGTGAWLGNYMEVADMREGACVYHFINSLEIGTRYLREGIAIGMRGEADLSKSNIDAYWNRSPSTGTWTFSTEFLFEYVKS